MSSKGVLEQTPFVLRKGLDIQTRILSLHLAHHNCITTVAKLLSKNSQTYHDVYDCFTINQPFSLKKSRTLQIYPPIYPLWGIAFSHI